MYKPEVSTDISPKMKTNSEVCLYVLIFTDFLADYFDEKTNKNQDFFSIGENIVKIHRTKFSSINLF